MGPIDPRTVWYPCPIAGFNLGKIIDLSAETFTIQPLSGGQPAVCPYDKVFPAEEHEKDVEDNCALMYLNEATLLNNVKLRYTKDKIYTYVANILIAVNPYQEIRNLYSTETIKSYNGKSLGTRPPHVFAIGDKAYRDMLYTKQSQSIIVSGESGAGKTESTKYILRYLTESWGTTAGNIEERIRQSNPLLEAFGNAKTVRNNNSSRFGKFVEIHFDAKNAVCGGFISHYLLEKSRVCVQSDQERNYHIFYQLCAGSPADLQKQFRLLPPDQFHYLNRGCTQYFLNKGTNVESSRISKQMSQKGPLADILRDDVKDFQRTWTAMTQMGMVDGEKMSIFAVIAGILHMGNISFTDDPNDQKGGCMVDAQAEKSLSDAATLLGLNKEELRQALTSRVMQATRSGVKGTAIMVPLKTGEAASARDALAKSIYSHLFDHIASRINQALPFSSSKNFIGILDIAGFEYFQHNSFEQFCINYCNEKLQQFFNQRILREEQDLYEREGLGVKRISYSDNADCIELIERKSTGVFDLLDEENKLPRPTYDHFTAEVHAKNKNHNRLALPRKSKLKAHREIKDDQGFLVRHFAGGVVYNTEKFLEKNNDALHHNLAFLVAESTNTLVTYMYSQSDAINKSSAGKLNFVSVGSKFRSQLQQLLEKLQSTGTSFIRCIKPNNKMADHQFEGSNVLSQLQYAGMHSVLDLMQQGYPSRTSFNELYNMYKGFLPPALARLDHRLFCKALFKALGLDDKDFKFGMTKVFFRAGKFAEFDQLMKSDPENLAKLIVKVRVWLIRSRFKKVQYGAWSVIKLKNKIKWRRQQIVKIQSHVRKWLAVKKYRPRYKGMQKIRTLNVELKKMESTIQKLKQNKEAAMRTCQELSSLINSAIKKIQDQPLTREQVDVEYSSLVNKLNAQLSSVARMVEEQRISEEKERLRKIQDEMESERKKKEAEELERQEEEKRKVQRLEIEAKRKAEEEKKKKQEAEDRKLAEQFSMKLNMESEDTERRRQALEQERRDRELALRLAQEDPDQVEDVALPPPPIQFSDKAKVMYKQHDLSKWKYAELRDTINTSCDMGLLDACREEFHRRLKVYHAWKTKNRQRQEAPDDRIPKDVIESGKAAIHMGMRVAAEQSSDALAVQRFFRIPFVRPADQNRDGNYQKKGWWYAHFDGQWIARQLELHPDKVPVLLVAGVDDMQMCELSLEETGLTRKRGAEILSAEFETEWSRNGGEQYVVKHKNSITSLFLKKSISQMKPNLI